MTLLFAVLSTFSPTSATFWSVSLASFFTGLEAARRLLKKGATRVSVLSAGCDFRYDSSSDSISFLLRPSSLRDALVCPRGWVCADDDAMRRAYSDNPTLPASSKSSLLRCFCSQLEADIFSQ